MHNQNQRISNLESQISLLQVEIDETQDDWIDDGYNYLTIGNSITSHPLADYWWNEDVGMAASREDKDYVHLISVTFPNSSMVYAYNFYTWEVQSTDRSEALSLLNGYLSDKLNLATIQLSENVSDLSTFETDYEELLKYIKEKAPNAQIIVIDDFWDNGDKAKMKKTASEKENLFFVSLGDIKGKSEYQAGLGTIVYDKEGNEHFMINSRLKLGSSSAVDTADENISA